MPRKRRKYFCVFYFITIQGKALPKFLFPKEQKMDFPPGLYIVNSI